MIFEMLFSNFVVEHWRDIRVQDEKVEVVGCLNRWQNVLLESGVIVAMDRRMSTPVKNNN